MLVAFIVLTLSTLVTFVCPLASSTHAINFSSVPLIELQNFFYNSLFAGYEANSDIYDITHSKWVQVIESRGIVIVEIDWVFHDEKSLADRLSTDLCQLVTFIIKTLEQKPIGLSSCHWSLFSGKECSSNCRLPLRAPKSNDTTRTYNHGGYFEFVAHIAKLLEDEDAMVTTYLAGYVLHTASSNPTVDTSYDLANSSSNVGDMGGPDGSTNHYLRDLSTADVTEWRTSKPVRLFSNYGKPYDNFGTSISMHNDVVAVGAVTRDRGGLVYVFYRQSKTFYQDPYPLTGYQDYQNDFFGWSVGVYQRTIVVGAYQTTAANEGMTSVGAVYVFLHLSSGWTVESFIRLTRPTQQGGNKNNNNNDNAAPTYDNFGWALGLYKDTLMVGAYGDDSIGTSAGAVYAFDRAMGGAKFSWSLSQKLIAPDGSAYDAFGWSVSIYENTTVVGAYSDSTDEYSYVGSVYVYTRPAGAASYGVGSWSIMAKLQPADGGQNDFFGWAVAVYDNALVVGSNSWQLQQGQTMNEVPVGAVYTYTYTYDFTGDLQSREWIMETKLRPPGSTSRHFGNSVAMDGNSLLVGAFGELSSTNLDEEHGSAFVYMAAKSSKTVSRGGASDVASIDKVEWVQRLRLSPNLTTSGNTNFGYSVAVFDGVSLVGALLAPGSVDMTGAVFAFTRTIDKTARGHPVSETTYLALISFLPLLFGAMCLVIGVAMLFLKPGQGGDAMDYVYDETMDYSVKSEFYKTQQDGMNVSAHSESGLMDHHKKHSSSSSSSSNCSAIFNRGEERE